MGYGGCYWPGFSSELGSAPTAVCWVVCLVESGELSPAGEFVGEVSKFSVLLLADSGQYLERLVGGDLVALHQDPFGLPDQVAAVDRPVELVDRLGAGVGDRGMAGEDQTGVFGFVGERVRLVAVQVEGSQAVAVDVERNRQHAGRADVGCP